jgi:hypothetical protein
MLKWEYSRSRAESASERARDDGDGGAFELGFLGGRLIFSISIYSSEIVSVMQRKNVYRGSPRSQPPDFDRTGYRATSW